jgi:hypothetical protein
MQNMERVIFVQAVKGNGLYSYISRRIDELALICWRIILASVAESTYRRILRSDVLVIEVVRETTLPNYHPPDS